MQYKNINRRQSRIATMARLLPAVFVGLMLQACAVPEAQVPVDNYFSSEFARPAPGALVILLPPKSSSEDVSAGEKFVHEQLHRQLSAAGYRVKGLDAANYSILWNQEVEAAGGIYDAATGALRTDAYRKALSGLAQRIATDTQAALVVSHGLVIRRAQLSGTKAQWDGQSKVQPTSRSAGTDYRFDGATVALSVELLGIAGNGSIAFKTYGGVALPYRADTWDGKNEIRKDMFAKDTETAEGVHIALRPLLRN